MRRTAMALVAIVALLAGGVVAQQKRQQDIDLQAAIRTETVDGDLQGAIKQYGAIVSKYKADRATSATALVHMAECYQKIGDSQARRIYEQLVRDYADQKDAVALARTYLRGTEIEPRTTATAFRKVWAGPKVLEESGTISPNGRELSFTDWETGDLALHDIATGGDRHLTNSGSLGGDGEFSDQSAISRDGKQVAYGWHNRKDRYELRVIGLQQAGFPQPRRLLESEDLEWIGPSDWSPDGRFLAVQFERYKDPTLRIGLVALGDGSLREIKSVNWSGDTKVLFSPDGKYVAYNRPPTDTSQQRDVFVLAIDGNREIPAVVHGANDVVMGWSPDGTRLLFSSDRTGTVGVWAQPFADGRAHGSPELLKSDIGPSSSMGLTSSGALYVFKRTNTRDIEIAPIDLEAGKLLGPPVSFTQGFVDGARNPAWSPDGEYLAYPVTCRNGCIAVRSVATGQVRLLAPTLVNGRVPHWLPDGRSLLANGRDATGRNGIFKIDVQSGEATPVILSDGLSVLAQWSPDGKKIYFNRNMVFVERDLATQAERVVNSDVGERMGVLSPDGQYFAVARADPSANEATLMLVPVTGGQPRELLRLTQSEALFRPLGGAWTPDSSALIIQKHTGSRWELWLVPVRGGQPRKLDVDPNIWRTGIENSSHPTSRVQEGDAGFSLSPDGRRIAIVTGETKAEVWVLENFLPKSSR